MNCFLSEKFLAFTKMTDIGAGPAIDVPANIKEEALLTELGTERSLEQALTSPEKTISIVKGKVVQV